VILPSRRVALRWIQVFLVGWLAFSGARGIAAPSAVKPNIVVFLSDDMGWGQLGFQGGKAVKTPHIDRLAREGVNLTQFYVECVCSPTRAALLTGRYPFRNGMEERTHGNDTAGMLLDERTLAQALRDAGYYTAILGKWHLGMWRKGHLPKQRGFDYQYGFYGAVIDSFTRLRGTTYDWHRNEQPLHQPGYSTFLIADEFVSMLKQQNRGKPFFFYVPFNAVHGPHRAPPEYIEKHNGNAQLAMLECMDIAVGRMIGALETAGVLNETLVIFLNDNGGPGRTSNAPYRGSKTETYEGGVRVACVMRWPAQIKAGSASNEMLHVVDLFPTLVQLVGGSIEQPLPLDGRNAWPTITQGKPSPHNEIVLSVPGFEDSETGTPAIRVGDFKLVGDELYDIRNDPYETKNLAAAQPDKVTAMKARLTQLAGERRQPEVHAKISSSHVVVLGEEENKGTLPDWLLNAAANANAEDPAPNTKKGGKKKKK
jgi:arylsulfatase A-like enzyme